MPANRTTDRSTRLPRLGWAGCLALLLLAGAAPAAATDLALAPWPVKVEAQAEALPLTGPFEVAWSGFRDPALERAVGRFQRDMARRTGLSSRDTGPKLTIAVAADDPGQLSVKAREGYVLQVAADGVRLEADGPVGVLRGLATLRQMVMARGEGFVLPVARIEDAPRFAWRGLMIDPARHFVDLETLKRQVDMMERVKLNVLHLHLSDNEGFRVESLRYPRLTEISSHGEYYSQAQIRELVTYAGDRGVRIVPEFDVPAHTGAILSAYPDLAAGPFDPRNRLSLFSLAMDPTRPETYDFLKGLFEEMSGLFPDAYFHIGGDEVSAGAWTGNPAIKRYMNEHGYADQNALQDHFFRQVKGIVDGLGKTTMGWEEVAHQPIADDVLVQAWRSSEAMGPVTAQGNRVVLSAGYYLDLLWPGMAHYAKDPADPLATPPNLPNEALPGGRPQGPLAPSQAALVLGAEAPLWSETLTQEMLESRLWPRAALLAERFWSPAEVRDEDDAARRIVPVMEGLRIQGLQDVSARRRMAARLSPADAETVEILASVTAPVRNMGRLAEVFAAVRTRRMPRMPQLNTVADLAAPDSVEVYRMFAWTDRYLEGDKAAGELLRTSLARYRDNHPRFVAAARGVGPLEAVVPVSEDVADLSRLGLEAIELREAGGRPGKAWREKADALLAKQAKAEAASASIPAVVGGAEQPPGGLLVLMTPVIARLVKGVSQ